MSKNNSSRGLHLNLNSYVPALITFLANKLSAGASLLYRQKFGIGIVEWRIMALLAVDEGITANFICNVIGLDKAIVSRTLKKMKVQGLVSILKSEYDARQTIISLTIQGKILHDEVIQVALAREEKLLEVLSQDEKEQLILILNKLNNQIPEVNG